MCIINNLEVRNFKKILYFICKFLRINPKFFILQQTFGARNRWHFSNLTPSSKHAITEKFFNYGVDLVDPCFAIMIFMMITIVMIILRIIQWNHNQWTERRIRNSCIKQNNSYYIFSQICIFAIPSFTKKLFHLLPKN